MIHLYSWGTPNGKKITIALEEMGLEYQFHPIDIMKGDQFACSIGAWPKLTLLLVIIPSPIWRSIRG